MCPRCFLGQKLPKDRIITSRTSRPTNSANNNALLFLQYPQIWIKIIQYCGVGYSSTLASISTSFYRKFNDDQFWNLMCIAWGYFDPLEESPMEDVYNILPDLECPETWKLFFMANQAKMKWHARTTRNCDAICNYLRSYLRYNNVNFGKARTFSPNTVYLLYFPYCSSDQSSHFGDKIERLYNQGDFLVQQAIIRNEFVLRSGAIAYQLGLYINVSGDVVMRSEIEDGTGFTAIFWLSVIVIYPAAAIEGIVGQQQSIMYSDVAECICEQNLLCLSAASPCVGDDSCSRSYDCSMVIAETNITVSTLRLSAADILSNLCVAVPSELKSMPFEMYFFQNN